MHELDDLDEAVQDLMEALYEYRDEKLTKKILAEAPAAATPPQAAIQVEG